MIGAFFASALAALSRSLLIILSRILRIISSRPLAGLSGILLTALSGLLPRLSGLRLSAARSALLLMTLLLVLLVHWMLHHRDSTVIDPVTFKVVPLRSPLLRGLRTRRESLQELEILALLVLLY